MQKYRTFEPSDYRYVPLSTPGHSQIVTVFRMRQVKCYKRYNTLKIPPCSKIVNVGERSNSYNYTGVKTNAKKHIFERDAKQYLISQSSHDNLKYKKTLNLRSLPKDPIIGNLFYTVYEKQAVLKLFLGKHAVK